VAPHTVYHRKRDSIEAHLTIVFAALAVSRWIERQTGWSIKKFVRTARRYRTIQIQAGPRTITAADPLPDDLRDALDLIHGRLQLPQELTHRAVPAGELVAPLGRTGNSDEPATQPAPLRATCRQSGRLRAHKGGGGPGWPRR